MSFLRVSRGLFYDFLRKIEPQITISKRGKINAVNRSGIFIPNEIKLAAKLRFLARGSYVDIAFEFGLSQPSFFHENYVL